MLFLGTGSRSVQAARERAVHVRVPGFGDVLLDADEGHTGGCRLRAARRARRAREPETGGISHKHLDHQGGLRLLERAAAAAGRRRGAAPRRGTGVRGSVPVPRGVAPRVVRSFVRAFNDPSISAGALMESARRSKVWLGDLVSVPVRHCGRARGRDGDVGRKIVYSGDVRATALRAGVGATLLIHEATFDDDVPKTGAQAPLHGEGALGVAAK